MSTTLKRGCVLTLCGVAISFAAQATDIYRWVDESGRTQYSDTVPDKYRAGAVTIDSKQFELSPEQLRDARARIARAQAEQAQASAATARGALPTRPPIGLQPSTSGPDCDLLFQRYRESQECFAPFHNANGSLRVEAFRTCQPVDNPTSKCGSPKAY